MGIPAYFSHIIKNYPSILKNLQYYHSSDIPFHSLYMDCNSIIYDSLRKIPEEQSPQIEQQIITNVIQQIEFYIQLVKPIHVLFIAFDGVAPLAKMEQQRQRRYKSIFMKEITKTIQEIDSNDLQNGLSKNQNILSVLSEKSSKNNTEKTTDSTETTTSTESSSQYDTWNTNAITPGTSFMQHLSQQIRHAFLHTEIKYNVKKVIVSTSEEPGEGEHKMFHHIRMNIQPHDNIVVYGLDSDLIMLSLFHYNLCNNIYILKETPEYMKKKPEDVFTVLDIQLLFQSIVTEMACDREKNRAYDYIFLCFFIGNDFLPHFPSLNIRTNGIHVLLDCYRKVVGKSSNVFIISKMTGKIQWKIVEKIVRELSKFEKTGFIQNDKYKEKLEKIKVGFQTPKEKMELVENTPVFYRQLEKYICPYEIGWEDRYYKALFHHGPEKEHPIHLPDLKKEVAMNYLEGLEWTFKYYTEGCPDWRWKYHYHFPPLFQDLLHYVPHFEMDFIGNENKNAVPFLPKVQLAYVLPIESHRLMDEETRRILHTRYSPFYTKEIDFQWAYCRYLWESHLILPDIPLGILNEWNLILK